MSRISMMTSGLLMILVGVQLNLVESFVLTPRATQHWNKRTNNSAGGGNGAGTLETVPGNYRATSNGYFQSSEALNNRSRTGSTYQANNQRDYTYSIPSYRRSPSSSVPTYQSSYGSPAITNNSTVSAYGGPQKMLTTPSWCCWPPIFLGSVLFLFGAAKLE